MTELYPVHLQELKSLYINTLTARYGPEEALSIFYIALQHLDGMSRHHVIIGGETHEKNKHIELLKEVEGGRPIQYCLGIAEFMGLSFEVDSSVLIPRPETEELVSWVMEDVADKPARILDIGTGSGCIAIALKRRLPEVELSACDISNAALEVAKRNALRNTTEVNFYRCNILEDTIAPCDIVVSNPPYIAHDEKDSMEEHVKDYEPKEALFVDGHDVLIFYKRIAELARLRGASCYMETSALYSEELSEWMKKEGYRFEWRNDVQGKPRMIKISF